MVSGGQSPRARLGEHPTLDSNVSIPVEGCAIVPLEVLYTGVCNIVQEWGYKITMFRAGVGVRLCALGRPPLSVGCDAGGGSGRGCP